MRLLGCLAFESRTMTTVIPRTDAASYTTSRVSHRLLSKDTRDFVGLCAVLEGCTAQ